MRTNATYGFPQPLRIAASIVALAALAACETPITLIERAVEARSSADIVEDNRIVADVNGAMADIGTLDASTEIYEQRLLVTGAFDDPATLQRFENAVRGVDGVRTLYWHARYVSPEQREAADDRILSWADALALGAKVKAALVGRKDVASVNLRIATDTNGDVYLLGRSRSSDEKRAALAEARSVGGVGRVVDYIVVRP